MAVSPAVAKQLCTKAELDLFTEGLARNVKQLDARALRSRIGRARKLRDKYRGRANRQDREARGKQPPRRTRAAQGSAPTRKKEQLFAETLNRFEKQLAKLSPPKKSTAKRAPTRTAAAASTSSARAKKKTAKKPNPLVSQANRQAAKASARGKAKLPRSAAKATTAAKQARGVAAGKTRIEKHISAQNRRKQARRDAR